MKLHTVACIALLGLGCAPAKKVPANISDPDTPVEAPVKARRSVPKPSQAVKPWDTPGASAQLAPAGDTNGDGAMDFLVWQSSGTPALVLFLGDESGALRRQQGWAPVFPGPIVAVAADGDVNGDGYSDIVVATPISEGKTWSLRALLFLGSAENRAASPAWVMELGTAKTKEQTLISAAFAGDINKDRFDDVVFGVPDQSDGGHAYVFFGSNAGLSERADWGMGSKAGAAFGTAVVGVGDVNGDQLDDFAVGAPLYRGFGRTYLFFGSSETISTTPSSVTDGNGLNDRFGSSLVRAGDINADGNADLLVGAPSPLPNTPGRLALYLGSRRGFSPKPSWQLSGTQLGVAIGRGGDINGDGYSDVIVHSPDTGHVDLYYGTRKGLCGTAVWSYPDGAKSVSSVGDINRDHRHDLAVVDRDGAVLIYSGAGIGAKLPPGC